MMRTCPILSRNLGQNYLRLKVKEIKMNFRSREMFWWSDIHSSWELKKFIHNVVDRDKGRLVCMSQIWICLCLGPGKLYRIFPSWLYTHVRRCNSQAKRSNQCTDVWILFATFQNENGSLVYTRFNVKRTNNINLYFVRSRRLSDEATTMAVKKQVLGRFHAGFRYTQFRFLLIWLLKGPTRNF